MTLKNKHVMYSTPWTRTTQSLGCRKIEKAKEKVSSFLNTCTTTEFSKPDSLTISINPPFDSDEPREPLYEYKKQIELRFGKNSKKGTNGVNFETGEPVEMTLGDFELDTNQINEGLDFLIENQPWPKYSITPVELIAKYTFELIDPRTNKAFQGIEHHSTLLIWFSQNSKVNATFWFPFSEEDDYFWSYAEELKTQTPFKFDFKYLRSVSPNKKGTNNVFRKIKHR